MTDETENIFKVLSLIGLSFYRPLVVLHGYNWHLAPIIDGPALGYWQLFALGALWFAITTNLAKPADVGSSQIWTAGFALGVCHLIIWLTAL